MKKFLLILPLSISITFILFAFMARLIASDHVSVIDEQDPVTVQVYQLPDETPAQDKPPVLKERPTPPTPQPPSTVEIEPATGDNTFASHIPIQEISLTSDDRLPSYKMSDKEATPIVKIAPQYPIEAAQKGLSGWVLMQFTIDKTGNVDQATVLDSEPKRVFDKAALKALKKWKYQPMLNDGKPVAVPNQQVMLEFTLDKNV